MIMLRVLYLEQLVTFKHIVQSHGNTFFLRQLLDPHLTTHHSNAIIKIRKSNYRPQYFVRYVELMWPLFLLGRLFFDANWQDLSLRTNTKTSTRHDEIGRCAQNTYTLHCSTTS